MRSERELIERIIVRALRRDAPNQYTWKTEINKIADQIENGEITIQIGHKPEKME